MKTIYESMVTGNIIDELKPSLGETEDDIRITIRYLFREGYDLNELCSYLTKVVISTICECDLQNAINILETK